MSPTHFLCEAAGTTPERAAKKLQMHPRTLSKFINHGCCQHHAERIIRVLHCDPRILLQGFGEWQKHFLNRKSSGHNSGHNEDGCGRQSVAVTSAAKRRRDYIPKLITGGEIQNERSNRINTICRNACRGGS